MAALEASSAGLPRETAPRTSYSLRRAPGGNDRQDVEGLARRSEPAPAGSGVLTPARQGVGCVRTIPVVPLQALRLRLRHPLHPDLEWLRARPCTTRARRRLARERAFVDRVGSRFAIPFRRRPGTRLGHAGGRRQHPEKRQGVEGAEAFGSEIEAGIVEACALDDVEPSQSAADRDFGLPRRARMRPCVGTVWGSRGQSQRFPTAGAGRRRAHCVRRDRGRQGSR